MNYLALELIKEHEGLRLTMYDDTEGVPTIGYGHNLNRPISEEAANQILKDDVQTAVLDAASFGWFHNLNDVRKAVIIDMMYNLGLTRFKKFQRMDKAIRDEDYELAAYEMLDSKWAHQVGSRAEDLATIFSRGEI